MLQARVLSAVGIVAVAGCVAGMLAAQTTSPAFEVASIKLNKSGERASHGGTQPGGRFTATNVTLFQLIRNAYGLTDSQVAGGPSWINTDHFDIIAKMPEGSFDSQSGATRNAAATPMLQSLIADRFHVAFHHETRQLTEVSMVLAREDGKLGPRLVPSSPADTDCSKPDTVDFGASDPFNTVGPCGQLFGRGSRPGGRRMVARGITMDRLASTAALSLGVNPIVRNETRLSGSFNVDLEYAPQSVSAGPGDSAPLDDDPSVFTAFQEQLGLKLVMKKAPTDVLVIDHAERPTDN
jgi:uncharacterized protein (TIGR03435 family)